MRDFHAPAVRNVVVLASVAGATLLPAAAAGAKQPPGTVDPNSPAGKEYAIPLDSIRHAASGGSSGVSGGGSNGGGSNRSAPGSSHLAPAFGVGITPGAAAASQHARGERGVSTSGANRKSSAGASGSAGRAAGEQSAGAIPADSWTVGLTVGIVALVLAVGLGGRLLMHRFGRRTGP